MNALETIMRPVARLVNRQIRLTTPAQELCRELRGKVVAIRVKNTGLAMHVRVDTGGVSVLEAFEGEPDAAITGSLFSLGAMAAQGTGRAGQEAVRDGTLELTGDAEVARSFQRLLDYGKPDLEEELSGLVGDVAAHGLGEIARGIRRWAREAGSTVRQNLSEYLQEESRALPTRYEVEDFGKRVDTLRDDVARMEARLRLLESVARPDRSRG